MYAYIDNDALKASGYDSVKEFLSKYGTTKILGQPPPTKEISSYIQLQPGWSVLYRLKM